MLNNFLVESLFSTPVYRTNNSDLINENILKICRDLTSDLNFKKISNQDRAKVSNHSNVLDIDDFFHIKYFINSHLNNFFKSVYNLDHQIFLTNSFISIKEKNGFHHVHIHENSFISGTFYISLPNNSSKIIFHKKPEIFKGFENFTYDVREYNAFNSPKIYLDVAPGDLIIFPSHIQHSVEENNDDEPRIVLSFNSFIKGTFKTNYCGDLVI